MGWHGRDTQHFELAGGERRGKDKLASKDESDGRKEVSTEFQTEREEEGIGTHHMQKSEENLQIQQIQDAEPVNIQTPNTTEEAESEASDWVNSHILELSNTSVVAFEGFEKETLALLMRIDERKSVLDKKGQAKTNSSPKSRGTGKNELKNLKSCLNEEVGGRRKKREKSKLNLPMKISLVT